MRLGEGGQTGKAPDLYNPRRTDQMLANFMSAIPNPYNKRNSLLWPDFVSVWHTKRLYKHLWDHESLRYCLTVPLDVCDRQLADV